MLKAIIGLLLLAPFTLVAQGWLPMGARSNSMGNSSVTLTDVWAFHHNPGAIAQLEKQAIGISYENRFLLKELQSQGLVYGQPLKKGVLSFGAQTYGFKTYRTNRVGVGYSMKLSELFSAGVQLNYQNIRLTENYGSKNTVTAELGILAKITDKWRIGVSAFNLGRNKLADFQDDRFTTLMRLGTSYTVSKKVLVTAEVEKNVDFAKAFGHASGIRQALPDVCGKLASRLRPSQIDFLGQEGIVQAERAAEGRSRSSSARPLGQKSLHLRLSSLCSRFVAGFNRLAPTV